jgi:O-antigen/teichoic acid export membrane protein
LSFSANSFSLLKRDIFLFGTNLITGVVVARKLGPAAMGLWIILQMIPTYAEVFGRMKFDIAAVYFLGRGKYKTGEVVFTLNLLACVASLAMIGIFLIGYDWFCGYLFGNATSDVKPFIYLMLLQIPLQFLYMNYSYLFIYREDVQRYNWMTVIKALFSSCVSIPLLVFFDLGLTAVAVPTVLATLLGLLYGISRFRSSGSSGMKINVSIIRDLFSYGSKLYLAGLIGSLNAYVTNLVVVFYLMPAQVAFFNMAQNKGILINKVPDAMNTILFPRVSKADDPAVSARLVARAFRVALLILLLLGLLAFVSIRPLVYILYGSDYLPMVIPFWILLPGLVLSGAAGVTNQYFTGIGRADLTAKILVFPLLIQVPVAILLIPPLGIAGAAISFLIALLCITALQIVVFIRISNCTLHGDLIIQKEDVLTVRAFIASQLDRFKTGTRRNLVALKGKVSGF